MQIYMYVADVKLPNCTVPVSGIACASTDKSLKTEIKKDVLRKHPEASYVSVRNTVDIHT